MGYIGGQFFKIRIIPAKKRLGLQCSPIACKVKFLLTHFQPPANP